MISAKIICDSVNPRGTRITTFELVYPRIIHGELLTHRLLSRNSASSRAIPGKVMLENILQEPATPVHWGKNQAGMQAEEELDPISRAKVINLWHNAVDSVVDISQQMIDLGAHKQVVNRITEFAQHMKVVVTATQYQNLFWLRDHKDADPTLEALAKAMHSEFSNSIPTELAYGEWHMPYVKQEFRQFCGSTQVFLDEHDNDITLEEAQMISSSCCAQVSYRKSDGSLEKARTIYERLIEAEPVHASPVEHQAMCIDTLGIAFGRPSEWPEGVTHLNRDGTFGSGNLKDWIQFRQLIPNNAKNDW